ncbi:hypothetical protein RJT34_02819 [Clitoria ternatea]|uniref:Uncharacterized protein n=1 Tax=Clitoria ternatea TaxID=43366 RepID=A0AAN9KJM5_CLITE
MEKSREEKHHNEISKASNKISTIWDCGSTLYDSYELNTFKTHLDSAIANSPRNIRTLSMPHLPQRYVSSQIQPQPQPQPTSSGISNNNKSFKISRTFQKLLRFVFKSRNKPRISTSSNNLQVAEKYSKERFYVVYDKYDQPVLSTIPELPEFDVSPEITSFVRKSASERFTATATIGVSCA